MNDFSLTPLALSKGQQVNPNSQASVSSLQEFLEAIHGEISKLIEIRLLARSSEQLYELVERFFYSRNKLINEFPDIQKLNQDKLPQWQGDYGFTAFFSAAPRWRNAGKKSDVRLVPCLWADLDFTNFEPSDNELVPGARNAQIKLHTYSPQPTVIVFSGHGFHLYWRLDKPSTDIPRCEATMAEIARELNGDHVQDINRMMRLPNTVNWKDPDNPVLCHVVEIRR